MATVTPLALALRDTVFASPVSLALAHPAGPSSASLDERAQAFGEPHGLREIDELVRDADARGFVVVQASGGVLDAVTRHVERRARALGRAVVKIDGLPTDDPWRELVARFQSSASASAPGADASTAAQAVIDRAGAALVLVREGVGTSFGRALAAELSRLSDEGAARALFLVLAEAAPPASRTDRLPSLAAAAAAPRGRVVEIEAEVSSDELQIWWDAVARDPAHGVGAGLDRLDAVESWWAAACATPLDRRAETVGLDTLSPEARRLFVRIGLSQRSWLASQVGRLGTIAAAQDLVRAGALTLDQAGRLVAGPVKLSAAPADAAAAVEDAGAVAAALDVLDDPWAAARASELHAIAGAFERAELASERAVSAVADPSARADFWRRWERTLAALPESEALPRLLRSVDVALRAGDVERALDLGNAALSRRGDSFAALLALGRTNVARGDLSTASYWLGKAKAAAGNRSGNSADAADAAHVMRGEALVEVEVAEMRLLEGDTEGARRHATAVLAAPVADASTRLHARNVLGKLVLAAGSWSEAEAHFAADACEAAVSGDVVGELRARLNRSIALLSSGRLDDARAMLLAVLDEGEARGELRAVAYALSNLASIAILKREYVEALRLSERAFDARRRLGDKVTLALLITNIAELKLQLGMVGEAEQALAFGRQACGPGMPGSRASHFAITAALIHLERGRTALASAELRTALATARSSPHGARLGECWRLAARIALEDGDLAAAETALGHAATTAETPRERAWVAVLEATRARACGEPFSDAADEALERARAADDAELCREAHVLLHHAALLDGDGRGAGLHLESAVAMRDQIADALPEDMRRRFLARRDLAELARLVQRTDGAEGALNGVRGDGARAATSTTLVPAADDGAAPRPSFGEARLSGFPAGARSQSQGSRAPVPALRRLVGRTPAMAALSNAIVKVGQSDATVLVHGESGTGKELVAEAIHEASARRSGPIVKVNCAALVETLLLSELFGHEKGSFTGAAARRRGRFEVAEGGTLFLDEIGDISPRTQVALLRVLQDKTFERVGGVTPIRANVRIVCATHRDLLAMVGRGEFREDLYYRLRGVVLEVPALRQRIADLPHVTAAILDQIAAERGIAPQRLSADALAGLARHPWPGNIRELQNALRAATLFAEGEVIELSDFTTNVDGLRGLRGADALVPQERAIAERSIADDVAPVSSPAPVTLSSTSILTLGGAMSGAPTPVSPAFAGQSSMPDSGTDAALESAAMQQPSKIAQSGVGEAPGRATEVAYATIRGGVSLSDLKRDIERDCIARALAETGGNITRAATLLGMKRPRLSQLVKQYGFGAGATAGGDVESDAEDGE